MTLHPEQSQSNSVRDVKNGDLKIVKNVVFDKNEVSLYYIMKSMIPGLLLEKRDNNFDQKIIKIEVSKFIKNHQNLGSENHRKSSKIEKHGRWAGV